MNSLNEVLLLITLHGQLMFFGVFAGEEQCHKERALWVDATRPYRLQVDCEDWKPNTNITNYILRP